MSNLFGFVSNDDFIREMERLIRAMSGEVTIEKTITQNGVYDASADNVNGYSKVTVNVSAQSGAFSGSAKGKLAGKAGGTYTGILQEV